MPSSNSLFYSVLPCYLNTLSFGLVVGFTSPMLSKMEAFGEPFNNLPDASAWFTSIATIGAMVGSMVGGSLVDRLGRRRSITITAFPYLVGWLAIAFGKTPFTLNYGRFLTGAGIGMTCVVCPMFISEISTKELRGKLGSCFQLCVTIGIILAYTLGMFISWRNFALLLVILPIITIAFSTYTLESPRYLIDRGLKTEAYRNLLQLRDTSSAAEDELLDMEESAATAAKKLTFADFREAGVLKPLKVALTIMLLQQLTGINVVMFYTTTIFESAGFQKDNSDIASCLIAFVQIIFTFFATILMDKAGRKLLLLVAGAGMGVSCIFMSYCYHQQEAAGVVRAATATAAAAASANTHGGTVMMSLVAYIAFFSLGWGPVPMVLASEIFPSKVKGTALGGSVFFSWITAFIVTLYFPVLKLTLGMAGVFGLFALFCFSSVVYVYMSVPETKGRSLDDIAAFFTLPRPIRSI